MADEVRRVSGADLGPWLVGKYIVRQNLGYMQPGLVTDLAPEITNPSGAWLTRVTWVRTPVDNASAKNLRLLFSSTYSIVESNEVHPAPGTAAAERQANPDAYATAHNDTGTVTEWHKLVQSGQHEAGLAEKQVVRAGDLTPADLGRCFWNADETETVNYPIMLMNYRVVNEGTAPGVTLWLRHGEIDGRPAFGNEYHVRFDWPIEFVDLTAL